MYHVNSKRDKLRNKKNGFTLIEILIVLSIMGIVLVITIPSLLNSVQKAKAKVCLANILHIERMYEFYLKFHNLSHTDLVFAQYLYKYKDKKCPDQGEFSYVEGKVKCSLHKRDESNKNDDDNESVPFL